MTDTVVERMARLSFNGVLHPACSPDPVICNFSFFGWIKERLSRLGLLDAGGV
jgi:hypothetical protein